MCANPIESPISNRNPETLVLQWTNVWRNRDWFRSLTAEIVMVCGGTVLLILLTQIRIPMVPVPITGQTLGVLLIGAALGWQRGAVSVLVYLLIGIAGAPVFAAGIGPAAFVGPTGGYLWSFLPAVMVVGFLAERGWDRHVPGALVTFLIGHSIIFTIGVTWLAVLMGMENAIQLGLLPFIPGMLIKTAIATAALPLAWTISPFARRAKKQESKPKEI